MKAETKAWAKPAAVLALFLMLVFVVGLLLASYIACLVFLLGVLLPLLTWRILLSETSPRGRSWLLRKCVDAILSLILFASIVFLILRYLESGPFELAVPPPIAPIVEGYTAVIEPIDSKVFSLREEAFARSGTEEVFLELPERQVASTCKGLLLREVRVVPLQASSGVVSLALPDGTSLRGSLCTYICPESGIELRNMPKDSFCLGKDMENLERYPYIDTETVAWSVRDLEQGIVFAYIPAPFHYLRPVLAPFIEASSLGQLIIGLFGTVGTLIVASAVKPILFDIAKSRLKSWFDRAPKKEPRTKVTLIVSGKGEEKEIEIKEDESR